MSSNCVHYELSLFCNKSISVLLPKLQILAHKKHVKYIYMKFPPTCFGGGLPSSGTTSENDIVQTPNAGIVYVSKRVV